MYLYSIDAGNDGPLIHEFKLNAYLLISEKVRLNSDCQIELY